MAKIEYDGMTFDSEEEIWFWHWLTEAWKHGLIEGFRRCQRSYTLSTKQTYTYTEQLKTKVKTTEKHLLHPHVFTPDFRTFGGSWFLDKKLGGDEHVIDVKGTYSKFHDQKSFSINQKFMYEKYGIYVHVVKPVELFKKTFVPELVRYTKKTGKVQKRYINTPTIKEYLGVK
ncbi:MAG: hypothetical protein GY714_18305 [Desulfobacterales bacterium]|nr:hypothetical protein [Desulfobacterales bacterium]